MERTDSNKDFPHTNLPQTEKNAPKHKKFPLKSWIGKVVFYGWVYSETLNNEYMERIHQMSYSSLSDNGML